MKKDPKFISLDAPLAEDDNDENGSMSTFLDPEYSDGGLGADDINDPYPDKEEE